MQQSYQQVRKMGIFFFNNISREECLLVSSDVLKNANDKFISSEKLAQEQKYGSAISFLIIGSEELIKAMILFLDGIGFRFRSINDMQKVFKNHELRYFVSFIIFSLSVFSDDLMNFIIKIQNQVITIDDLKKIKSKIKSNDEYFRTKIFQHIISRIEFLLQELSWFKNCDIYRQNGLYVDYKDGTQTPLNLKQKDYEELKIRIERVRLACNQIFEGLNNESESNKEYFSNFLSDFNQNNFYEIVGNFIKKIRKERINALDYILKNMESIIKEIKNDLNSKNTI